MRDTFLILHARWRLLDNYVGAIRKHLLIHLAVGLGVVFVLIMGGMGFFSFLFWHLSQFEDFGNILMDRLIGMVMMAFFSMLIFSNLIITLSTTYISRDVTFLMSQPVSHRSIFFVKLVESVVYSSWAFVILSLPVFLSFGLVRGVAWGFYFGVGALIVPFLVIPAAIGSMLTMLLGAFLPAKRAMKWTIALVLLALVGGVTIVRMTGVARELFGSNIRSFSQVLTLLQTGSSLWSPHTWMTEGVLELSRGNIKMFWYWLAMLCSTALMLLQVCAWLAPPLYYRGWCLARSSGGNRRVGAASAGIFGFMERVLGRLRPSTRALVIKDMKTFWRDPAQWSQLVILFGILFIYMANLRGAYWQRMHGVFLRHVWVMILSFFNLGATSFMLSILTTRFVYPMLSLEGKQFWAVGLAPLRRERVVWEKYWLCWGMCVVLAEALTLFSNWMLRVPVSMQCISALAVLCISFGLTSLAVGLGAATPNFREDNPARIANGLGGTLNVILSLSYIGGMLAAIIWPVYLRFTGALDMATIRTHVLPYVIAAVVVLQVLAMWLPMRIGLRRWRNMEF